jgi:hypothetical protein
VTTDASIGGGPLLAAQPRINPEMVARVLFLSLMIGATSIAAWRNVRSGRADIKGTTRVAAVSGVLELLYALLQQHYALDALAYFQAMHALMQGLLVAFLSGVGYRRKSVSGPKGPRICCALPTSNRRTIMSPILVMRSWVACLPSPLASNQS